MKRVGVIGGGIFGVTAAVHCARAGHDVHLFEQHDTLLAAASGINQYRLHRGYHYPRSPVTVQEVLASQASFREEYGDAVIEDGRHLYAIARERSLVSGAEFIAFCDAQKLRYRTVRAPELLNMDRLDVVIEAVEARFDPEALRISAIQKLDAAGVTVHRGTPAPSSIAADFDQVVIAAYAATGGLVAALTGKEERYQFEVCEKPVVALPPSFGNTDIVVLDGPFMSVDPFGRTGHYVLGHVEHAIHYANVGVTPEIPAALRPYLDRGVIAAPAHTRIDRFLADGKHFIPALGEARHVGSMYTVRTVVPGVEKTDERLTSVVRLNARVIRIFSGKIGSCVEAARKAAVLIS